MFRTLHLLPLFSDLLELEMEAMQPLRTEEYPVEFEHQEIIEASLLEIPAGKAWQNPHELIGRR